MGLAMPDDRAALATAGASPADEALANVFQPEIAAGGAVLGGIGRGIRNFNEKYKAMPAWDKRAQAAGEAEAAGNHEMARELAMEMAVPGVSGRRSAMEVLKGSAKAATPKTSFLRPTRTLGKQNFFKIFDEKGTDTGSLILDVSDPKNLYIDNVYAIDRGLPDQPFLSGPNTVGPKQVRAMLHELKAMYPEMETIRGFRVSGGREAAGKQDRMATIQVRVADERGANVIDNISDENLMYLFGFVNEPPPGNQQ